MAKRKQYRNSDSLTPEEVKSFSTNSEVRNAMANVAMARVAMWHSVRELEDLLHREISNSNTLLDGLEGASVSCDTHQQVLDGFTDEIVADILRELEVEPIDPYSENAPIVPSNPKDPWPDGMRVYDREATKFGIVISRKDCNLEGCRGLKLCVKWPDGKRTWPCTKGLLDHPKGMKIGG